MKRATAVALILLIGATLGMFLSNPPANAVPESFTDAQGDTGDPEFDIITYWQDADTEVPVFKHGLSLAQAPSNSNWGSMGARVEFQFDRDGRAWDPEQVYETVIRVDFRQAEAVGVVLRDGQPVGEVAIARPDDRSLSFDLPVELLDQPEGSSGYNWRAEVSRSRTITGDCFTPSPASPTPGGSPAPSPTPVCPHGHRFDQDFTEVARHEVEGLHSPKEVPADISGRFTKRGRAVTGRISSTAPCVEGRSIVVRGAGRGPWETETGPTGSWRLERKRLPDKVVAMVRAVEHEPPGVWYLCTADRTTIRR